MDGAEGVVCSVVWETSGRAGSDGKILEVVPYRDHPRATMAQPTPRGWGFPVLGLAESPPARQSWGCHGLVLFSSANIPEKQEAAQG